jgi:superfamily II DNA/RNA helicase
VANETRTFIDLGVDRAIADALSEAGITNPFPIQELTLPMALAGADVIGQARTGSGKTLAFGIPLLQRADPQSTDPQALVVVPTRELCMQVRGDLEAAGRTTGHQVLALYGGKALDPQAQALGRGAPVVVGTPGRLLDLHSRGVLNLSAVTQLVLDEADEMLDLGFLPDVEQLIEATSAERQTLLFSATMPAPVVALARRYMRKPTFLRAEPEEARLVPETRPYFLSCHRLDKPAVLARILQAPGRGLCVVFTRTKHGADKLVQFSLRAGE